MDIVAFLLAWMHENSDKTTDARTKQISVLLCRDALRVNEIFMGSTSNPDDFERADLSNLYFGFFAKFDYYTIGRMQS